MSHGLGSLTEDKRNGNWKARYWGLDSKQHSKTFKPNEKTKARQFLAKMAAQKASGNWIDPRSSQIRFEVWAEEWFAGKHRLGPHARYRDGILLRRHVIPAFAGKPLGKVSALDVKAWVNALIAQGLSPHTIHPCVRIFRAIMRSAVVAKLIPSAPIEPGIVDLPNRERRRERFLTELEVEILAQNIHPDLRVLIFAAAYSGCRWQELAGLKREFLDLENGELHVRGVLKHSGGGKVYYDAQPKTDASRRSVALPQRLVALFGPHYNSVPKSIWVFPNPTGGFLSQRWVGSQLSKAVEKAGIAPLTFHDLRHTHAAWCIRDKVQPLALQRRLGHKDIKTTMNTYGHLFPNYEVAIVENLDRRWNQAITENANVISMRTP